jgi:hypothetical protein
MALGMGTRNIAAALAAALAIPNGDPRIVTMVVMWTLWSAVLAAIGARIFAKQAGKTVEGGAVLIGFAATGDPRVPYALAFP